MAMILLDSDVLIDYLRGVEPVRAALQKLFPTGRLRRTVISQFELLAGSRQAAQKQAVTDLLALLKILDLDQESAALAANLKRELAIAGNNIGMADCLIAGIALTHRVPLLTRNRRHFERVPKLQLFELSGVDLESGDPQ